MITETKIDDSFPIGNFLIGGFSKPYKLDCDSLVGGILLYFREDIPANLIEIETKRIEGIYVEINLRNDKWLINCLYNPHKNMIGNHLRALSEKLDIYSTSYDNFFILGDFNINIEEQHIKGFCDNYSLKSLIRQPTSYKSPSNPSCIDLILTKSTQKFQSTCVLETGPTKIIKSNPDIFSDFLYVSINNSIKSSLFPSCLKTADITPIYKKGKKDLKDSYRPVSILPVLSKLYERSMFKQISEFFENIFSKNQCGFRKGHSTQQCLLARLEKWKRSVNSRQAFVAPLTELSKSFDCLHHEHLIAKLNAYGFSLPALRLIHDYLSHRKQRTRVNNSYSEWLAVMFGVLQGSILGPLLFNIF